MSNYEPITNKRSVNEQEQQTLEDESTDKSVSTWKSLQERNQWLLFDTSHDTPRRPHWDGDFSVSWNDPDNWHSYEEARELAEQNENWGVGFVCAIDNDDYDDGEYGVIDIDGGYDPDSGYKDWVKPLAGFNRRDYYFEYSVSETGVHIPVKGLERPEWWDDPSFEDREHEGVDLLTNSFVAFTGDQVVDNPDAHVGEYNEFVEFYLIDMYENITGENPLSGGSDDSESDDREFDASDEWLTESDLVDALNYIDQDVDYTTWRDIGFAIADYYAKNAGDDYSELEAKTDAKSTFKSWSKKGSKWDSDAERYADSIIESGVDNHVSDNDDSRGVSLGTLIHLARERGWEMPAKRTDEQVRALRRVKSTLQRKREKIEEDEDYDGPKSSAFMYSIVKVHEDDFEDIIDDVLSVVKTGTRETFERQRERHHQYLDDHIFIEDNQVKRVFRRSDVSWYGTEVLLDFALDVNRYVNVEDGPMVADVEITPEQAPERAYRKEVDPEVFNEPRRVRDELLDETFQTSVAPFSDPDIVDGIRKWVGRQDVTVVRGQKTWGLNDSFNEFVLTTGTINETGWADEPSTVYRSQDFAVEDSIAFSPDECPDYDSDEVAEIIELVTNIRVPERGIPVVAWFYASPFKRRIMDVTGQFNALNVTGESDSGKSSTLAALSPAFGLDGEPNNLEQSNWAFTTKFLVSNGPPVWFDEYKRSDMADYLVNRIHRFLRATTSGEKVESGNQDRSTEGWKLHSPLVLSGEDQLNGTAEERRTIQVKLLKAPSEEGSPHQQTYKELTGEDYIKDGEVQLSEAEYDLPQHALAYYQWVVGTGDDEFERAWRAAKRYVVDKLGEWGHAGELSDMERQGLQTVVFGYRRMIAFAESVGADLSELPGTDDLDAALQHIAPVGDESRESDLDRFLKLASRAAVNGDYVEEGEQWRVVHEGREDEELRLNVGRAFDKVSRYVRDHDIDETLLSAAKDYRQRFQEAFERDESYVVNYSQNTHGIGRAVGIDMQVADGEITGFERSVFVDEEDDPSVSDFVSSDDDDNDDLPGDPVTSNHVPVNRVGEALANDTGYVDVTAKVTNWEPGPEDTGIAAMGSVQDVTGTVDVIDFFGSQSVALEEGEHYLIEQAQVDTYEGKVQLVIRRGTTTAKCVQPGVGYTSGDPGDNTQLNDVDEGREDEPVAADGGDEYEQAAPKVLEYLEGRGSAQADEVVNAIDGYDEDSVRSTLDSLLNKGRVYHPVEGDESELKVK